MARIGREERTKNCRLGRDYCQHQERPIKGGNAKEERRTCCD